MTNSTYLTPSVADESVPAGTHDSTVINQTITLNGGSQVLEAFLASIQFQAESRIPVLISEMPYTSRMICG